jgi:hypothetical protein
MVKRRPGRAISGGLPFPEAGRQAVFSQVAGIVEVGRFVRGLAERNQAGVGA